LKLLSRLRPYLVSEPAPPQPGGKAALDPGGLRGHAGGGLDQQPISPRHRPPGDDYLRGGLGGAAVRHAPQPPGPALAGGGGIWFRPWPASPGPSWWRTRGWRAPWRCPSPSSPPPCTPATWTA